MQTRPTVQDSTREFFVQGNPSLLAFAGSVIWSLVGGVVYLTLRNRHHLREVEIAAEKQE